MKKWVGLGLAVLLAATFINDFGRTMTAVYNLGNATRDIAYAAASGAKRKRQNPVSGWPAASAVAQKNNVEVTGYEQKYDEVHITTRMWVTGTWAVGPFLAWRNTGNVDWNTPFEITNAGKDFIR